MAVCDLEIDKAKLYRDEFGAPAYDNYHRMLREHPGINTVAIATPSGMHFEHALEVMERYRKNVIVEKPTFMNPSQVQRAYEAAKKAGVRIFPVFQNRHNLAVQRVLKGLREGELKVHVHKEYALADGWRLPDQSGGPSYRPVAKARRRGAPGLFHAPDLGCRDRSRGYGHSHL